MKARLHSLPLKLARNPLMFWLTFWLLLAVVLPAGSQGVAGNLTERNVEQVAELLESLETAHGGEQLLALETLAVAFEDVNIAAGQSRRPDPPWDRNQSSGLSAIDLKNRAFANRVSGSGGGFDFRTGTIIQGDSGYQLNFRAGTAAPMEQPDFDNTSGPFIRVMPALLVRELRDNLRTAHYLGESRDQDASFDVIGFSMAVGPAISLYIDQATGLLRRSERVFGGFGLVQYRFDDYETVEGLAFNRSFTLLVNGDVTMERNNLSIKVNQPLGDLLAPDDQLKRVAAVTPDPMTRQELDSGVYLIGGSGTYGLFIEMEDHVIAVGGTGGLPERLAQLREVIADKPIRYGVLTHHHSDHVLAVNTYAEAGATVVAASAHEGAVRDGADSGADLKLKLVDNKLDLGDRKRKVELVDIGPTAHTEHLLVTWLPDSGILFEADHFARPATGPVQPAVQATRTFAQALKRHGLAPERIVSAHSPRPGTLAELRQALAAKVVDVSAP